MPEMGDSEFQLVMTSSDQRSVLEQIARELVEKRLAACVQISGPVTSVYRWDGRINSAEEYLATAKTHRSRVDSVIRCVQASHNYSVPEIICVPVSAGATGYLDWIRDEVSGDPGGSSTPPD